MSFTTFIFRQLSKGRLAVLDKTRQDPRHFQRECFDRLLSAGKETSFGKEHNFSSLKSIRDFQKSVPLRNYDAFEPYIERLRAGEDYVLWNQKVKWFAKSSGTSSSKSKFIPITEESLNNCTTAA